MNLKISSLGLLIVSGIIFPSQVNSHAGSQRACFDMKGSVQRTSKKWRSGNPVPYWYGRKNGNTGGGRKEVQLRCMHSGVEKHRKGKGSTYCHSHYIADSAYRIQPKVTSERGDQQTKGKHYWFDASSHKKCRKTG